MRMTTGGALAPSHEWIAALEMQATVALLVRVQRYARCQARASCQVVTGKGEVEQLTTKLVADCVARTLSGAAAWDPAGGSLETHWIEDIGAQAAEVRAGMRGEPSPLVVSDTDSEDTEEVEPVRPAVVDAEVAKFAARQQIPRQSAGKMLQVLRVLVPSDQEILALLDDAQIHDEAMAEIGGPATAAEEHEARNLAQCIQGHIEHLRRAAETSRGRR